MVNAPAPEFWAPEEATAWSILDGVMDPEIPVLSVTDLGIVRHVRRTALGAVEIGLSPTYSGCPATDVIRSTVRNSVAAAGLSVSVVEVLSPPWSSDWLTAAGREKLRAFGIAPPEETVTSPRQLLGSPGVSCPRCASRDTNCVSEFGSTPCKAHYCCRTCGEPFDYFKCL
jgi:ring-1,2-phenylacetyl-CoA epoxidase subunit PaaD